MHMPQGTRPTRHFISGSQFVLIHIPHEGSILLLHTALFKKIFLSNAKRNLQGNSSKQMSNLVYAMAIKYYFTLDHIFSEARYKIT